MLRKLIITGFYYASIRYVVLAIALLKTYLIASGLGPEILGTYTLIILIVEYLNYVNLGVFNSMTRDIAVSFEEQERVSLDKNSIYSNSLGFSILMCGFLSIIFLLSEITSISLIPDDIESYIPIMLVLIISYQFKQYIIKRLRLEEEYLSIGSIELIAQSVNLIGIYLFVQDYLIDAVIYSIFASNFVIIILGFFISKNINLAFNYKIIKSLIKSGFPMLIHSIFMVIMMTIDRGMIIWLYTDRKALGLYQLGFILALGFFKAFESVTFLFQAKWLSHFAKDEKSSKKLSSIKEQTIYLELFTVFLSVLGIIFVPFVVSFFLPDYIPSIRITQFLLISFVFNGLTFFVNIYLLSSKKEYQMIPAMLIACIFSIFSNYFLVELGYGLYGFAFTKIMAFGVYGFLIYLTVYSLLKEKFLKGFLDAYLRALLFFIPTSVIIYEEYSMIIIPFLYIFIYSKLIYSRLFTLRVWKGMIDR